MRKNDLSPWKIVSYDSIFDRNQMIRKYLIFIEKDDNLYHLLDDCDKIDDVIKMPVYIKQDWINYNKIPTTIEVLNDVIERMEDLLTNSPCSSVSKNELRQLKAWRRNILIDKII